jgi:hypothetical protein
LYASEKFENFSKIFEEIRGREAKLPDQVCEANPTRHSKKVTGLFREERIYPSLSTPSEKV